MTHSFSRLNPAGLLVLIVLPILTCAYSSFAGGDHYEIYLNKRLVAKQFVAHTNTVLDMQLDKSNYNDQITVYYSHCGTVGNGRSILLKDDNGNLIKEWKFSDNKSSVAMTISTKEILDLKKTNGKLNLFYVAQELPKGRILAAVNFNNKNTVANDKSPDADWYVVSIVFTKLALIL